MNNNRYLAVTTLITIFNFLMEAYYMTWFLNGILTGNKAGVRGEFRRKPVLLLIPAGYIATMAVLKYIPQEVSSFGVYFLAAAAAFCLSFLIYQGKTILKLYVFITYTALSYLAHYLGVSMGSLFDALFRQINQYLWERSVEAESLWFLVSFLTYALLWQLLSWLVLHTMVSIILKYFRQKEYGFSFSEAVLLLVPSITGVFGGFFVSQFYIGLADKKVSSWFGVILPVSLLLFLAGIVANEVLFQSIKLKDEEKKEKEVMDREIAFVSSHIQKVEHFYAEISGLKHDIKNHVACMTALMEQGEYETAADYSREFENRIQPLEFPYKTGNPVTDAIINEYAMEAEQKAIQFESEFVFPINMDINAFDISIILNNALENAVEACVLERGSPPKEQSADGMGARKIKITSFRKKNAYFIQIDNTCARYLELAAQELPRTTKENKNLHGIGLKSIRRISQKYHGGMDIEYRNGEFSLSIMLMKMLA